ncbi:hypothetical protein AB0C76_11275 [Kitasatospora sp. NPDC048722]|uniref:hypothetical protein n=1 Tax=Kitasatospora sp. NPDC048722 TaxID=3155639 RepID=UPI0033E66404
MTTAPAPPLRDRLGLPATAGRARLIGAHVIDSLGTGLILAFTLVYFAGTTGLSVAAVGAAVSTARLLALPTAVAVGPLLVLNGVQVVLTQNAVARRLERFRPTRVVAAGTLLNALAFGLFALVVAAPGRAVLAGLFAAMAVYNLAETVATPFREDLSVSLADPELRGRHLALYQLSWDVGQAVAPALLTLLLARAAVLPWLFLLVLSAAAVPALLRLERTA